MCAHNNVSVCTYMCTFVHVYITIPVNSKGAPHIILSKPLHIHHITILYKHSNKAYSSESFIRIFACCIIVLHDAV